MDKKNPRSVTFFNSVIKTPLLRTLLMDIRQLRTLFFVPIEEKALYYGHQVLISLDFREKHHFLTKLPDCSVMVSEVNYFLKNGLTGGFKCLFLKRIELD